jgi:hypothetical protein
MQQSLLLPVSLIRYSNWHISGGGVFRWMSRVDLQGATFGFHSAGELIVARLEFRLETFS